MAFKKKKKKIPGAARRKAPVIVKEQEGKYPFVPPDLEHLCVPIKSLKLWDDNPRFNDESAVSLSEDIRTYLFRDPPTVDQWDMIRAGNTRYKAAMILGMTHIPIARSKFATKISAKAYGVSNNKAAEKSEWDYESLGNLLQSEGFEGYRGKVGFTEKEITSMTEGEKAPDSFQSFDGDDMEFDHCCPRCGFEWSDDGNSPG